MKTKKYSKDDYYCKKELNELGLTPRLVERFLPEPDLLRVNQHHMSGPKIQLWEKKKIEKFLLEPAIAAEVANVLEKRDGRKAAAKRAVDTKRMQAKALVEKAIKRIQIDIVPLDEIREAALQMQDDMTLDRGKYNTRPAEYADEATKERWMVNFIRHNLMTYDVGLHSMSLTGKVGCEDCFMEYSEAVFNKIAEAYPELESECDRQMDNRWKLYYMRTA